MQMSLSCACIALKLPQRAVLQAHVLKNVISCPIVEAGAVETLRRIESHDGVVGTIVVNPAGESIRTTMGTSITARITVSLRSLTLRAQSTVRDIDPNNNLTYLRIRSHLREIMVALENDHLLIVIQKKLTGNSL